MRHRGRCYGRRTAREYACPLLLLAVLLRDEKGRRGGRRRQVEAHPGDGGGRDSLGCIRQGAIGAPPPSHFGAPIDVTAIEGSLCASLMPRRVQEPAAEVLEPTRRPGRLSAAESQLLPEGAPPSVGSGVGMEYLGSRWASESVSEEFGGQVDA